MKNFDELMKAITKNIEYWSWRISYKTSIEKEDAYQELLLIIWREYCSRVESGRSVTKYFMQKRLQYAYIRIVRNFYHSMASVTNIQFPFLNFSHYEGEGDIIDERIENSKTKEWLNSIFDDLSDEGFNDGRVEKIFSMLREGYKNFEIAEKLGIKQNTLSIVITRKIKKVIKERIEENPFSGDIQYNDYVGVYS